MAWYTTEETLYFYETRRGLEPAETEQDAHLTLTLSTQEEYDRETGQVEQTQVQVDYAWSAGRPHWRGDDAITVTWDPGQDTYAGSFVSEHRADGAQYDQIGRGVSGPCGLVGAPEQGRSLCQGTGGYGPVCPAAQNAPGPQPDGTDGLCPLSAFGERRPPAGRSCGGAGHRGLVGAETH